MADIAHRLTDEKTGRNGKRLSAIYSRAEKEIQKTADEYFSKFSKQDEAYEIIDAYAREQLNLSIDPKRLPAATTTIAGTVKQAAAVANGSDLNTLLASLRAAGILATE